MAGTLGIAGAMMADGRDLSQRRNAP